MLALRPLAFRPLALALGMVVLLAGCSGASSSPPVTPQPDRPASGLTKVRMGVTGALSDAAVYVTQEKGYFKEQGLDVEIRKFNSGADQVASLNAGQLDIVGGGSSIELYNAMERGAQFRIVADKGHTPGPEWDYIALAVRKDLIDSGRVKTLADLKGLTVTSSGIGATTEVGLFTALASAQLTPNDVTYITLGNGDLPAAFASHSIDAAIAAEPFMTQLESQGTAVRFKGNSELFNRDQQVAVIIYSEPFAANTDVARRWMIAYIRGLRDYNDAFGPERKGRDQVIDILIKSTPVKEARLYDQMRPPGLDPDGKVDVDYFKFELDWYKKSQSIDLSKLIDTSFQEYAAQQLGPYQTQLRG